jgi:hypothetical protein
MDENVREGRKKNKGERESIEEVRKEIEERKK